MKALPLFAVTSSCLLIFSACSPPKEDGATDVEAVGEQMPAETEQTEMTDATTQSAEAIEICDEDGNRFASEADAAAAGLSEAQYGATYCEYIE